MASREFPLLPPHLALLPSQLADASIADQPLSLFVPETGGQRFQARKQRHRLHLPEQRFDLVTSLQIVVGNARAQMMNVMKADIAREPLQNLRQLVERAAPHRRR